jgi:UDP-4-amino-4,6-dideoxy-N-acetyl-beta-L-altrosamine transaminase
LTSTADFLPYGRQLVEDDDVAAVIAVLRGDYLTTGPAVGAFERAFADRVGAAHAVVVSSGGAALHLAALSLDLGPGDAALVPSMTFVATANAARLAGAEVIFCDVDPSNGLMSPDQLEAALAGYRGSGRPRVALPVHLNGQPCDMAGIGEVAQRHGLDLVEDACHALGGSVCGHPIGSARTSRLVMFSGHPVKSIAMGEGGILTTNDGALATRLRRLASHGLTRDPAEFVQPDMALDQAGEPNPWYYEQVEAGLNYRASDIHCALGLSQLSKLDRFVARRAELAERYERLLGDLAPFVRPVPQVSWGESGWHLYAVQINFDAAGIDRAALIHGLREQGIGSQVHYIPVHRQPYYRALYPNLDLPGADAYYAGCLSLPLFPAMADSDVDRVIEALIRLLPQST